jgi:hypothetical protein
MPLVALPKLNSEAALSTGVDADNLLQGKQ